MKNENAGALLVSAKQAAELCGISRATFWRLLSGGKIGPASVKLGRSVRWRKSELVAWCDAGCPPRDQWQAVCDADARRRFRLAK